MQRIVISKNMADKRIDKVIRETYPSLPNSAFYGLFKKRDIKVNGTRVSEDFPVFEGDVCEVYLDDLILNAAKTPNHQPKESFEVVYEDDNILVVNKAQGLAVHPDKDMNEPTLIDLVRNKYSSSNLGYRSKAEQIELCHRIDRNTGGLVILAKNKEALSIILDKFKKGEIKKYYKCYVDGVPIFKEATLKAYLTKDAYKSKVFISDTKTTGAVEIITKYKVIESFDDVSMLEVELFTGRTHQIRAHLAYIGHQVIGDGKYGLNSVNRKFGIKQQELWAYKIKFDFSTNAGLINYLKETIITCEPKFTLIPS
jgi:23S rRNA pseudouridine955/2504/2580 synthase